MLYDECMQTFITHSSEETRMFGQTLAASFIPKTLITLAGDLGAGKTTLIQGILAGLGAIPPYPSPTFVLMHQYELPQASAAGIRRVYHADAYRVGREDFEKIGFLDWCTDPEGIVIIERPERLGDRVPEQQLNICLKALSENDREKMVEKK